MNEARIKSINKTNTSSENSSMNRSEYKIKKIKENLKFREEKEKEKQEKQEKQMKDENDLIKKQYKIIKDFLTPILKEENARQLVSIYTQKMLEDQKPKLKKNNNNNVSLKNKGILDYSFVSGKSSNNKIKIPLFQIMYPNQYKQHLEQKMKQKNTNRVNRPCRHTSSENININMPQKIKKIKKIHKSKNVNINNNINNNNKDNNNNNTNANKINRVNSLPLYLRLDEVDKKHKDKMEKLKKKYEYKYTNKNKSNNKSNNSSFSSASLNESHKSRNNNNNNKTNFEKWYNYEKTWLKIKDMKLNMIRDEIEENKICMYQNIKDEETFKPKINKNSEMIMNKKNEGDFYLRLQNYENKKNRKAKCYKKH